MKIKECSIFFSKLLAGMCGMGMLVTAVPLLAETPRAGEWYYIEARHSAIAIL